MDLLGQHASAADKCLRTFEIAQALREEWAPLDCGIHPIMDAAQLEASIRAIPGVVGTGLFLGMADVALVGRGADFDGATLPVAASATYAAS